MTTNYTECCRSSVRTGRELVEGRFAAAGRMVEISFRECAGCGARSPRMVYITTHNTRSGNKSECGGACLNGKTSCDCKCKGRCHGASKCLCGQPVVA